MFAKIHFLAELGDIYLFLIGKELFLLIKKLLKIKHNALISQFLIKNQLITKQ